MPTSTLNAAALGALERAVNAALEMDTATRGEIAALAPTVFHIRCTMPEVEVFVFPSADGVRLQSYYEGKADCSVSGKASDFVALITATDKAGALVNGNLRITGDSAPLLALEKALSGLDVDWEQRLAVLLGDIPAHQLGRAVRGSLKWGRSAQEALLRHVEEFIHEEARLAPPRLEVEDFFTDLQDLTIRGERLEAGVRRLKRRVTALAERAQQRRGRGAAGDA